MESINILIYYMHEYYYKYLRHKEIMICIEKKMYLLRKNLTLDEKAGYVIIRSSQTHVGTHVVRPLERSF